MSMWGGAFDFLAKQRGYFGRVPRRGKRGGSLPRGYKTTLKTPWEQKAREHRNKLENLSGVKWSNWHTGNGWHFLPKLTKEIPLNELTASNLEPYITKEYQNFLQLAERSKMPLQDVLAGAQTLLHQRKILHDINRMGDIVVIKK